MHWLSVGLPLDRIKIVIRPDADVNGLRESFARTKRQLVNKEDESQTKAFRFDFFVSYSQKNKEIVDVLVHELLTRHPALRVFVDRLELQPGAAWQEHIFESLDQSRRVICAFSPDYLLSKVCKEEFNIALFRHRESTSAVLLPVYLYTAALPTYMKLMQYEDVREGDRAKIAQPGLFTSELRGGRLYCGEESGRLALPGAAVVGGPPPFPQRVLRWLDE